MNERSFIVKSSGEFIFALRLQPLQTVQKKIPFRRQFRKRKRPPIILFSLFAAIQHPEKLGPDRVEEIITAQRFVILNLTKRFQTSCGSPHFCECDGTIERNDGRVVNFLKQVVQEENPVPIGFLVLSRQAVARRDPCLQMKTRCCIA